MYYILFIKYASAISAYSLRSQQAEKDRATAVQLAYQWRFHGICFIEEFEMCWIYRRKPPYVILFRLLFATAQILYTSFRQRQSSCWRGCLWSMLVYSPQPSAAPVLLLFPKAGVGFTRCEVLQGYGKDFLHLQGYGWRSFSEYETGRKVLLLWLPSNRWRDWLRRGVPASVPTGKDKAARPWLWYSLYRARK